MAGLGLAGWWVAGRELASRRGISGRLPGGRVADRRLFSGRIAGWDRPRGPGDIRRRCLAVLPGHQHGCVAAVEAVAVGGGVPAEPAHRHPPPFGPAGSPADHGRVAPFRPSIRHGKPTLRTTPAVGATPAVRTT